MGSVKSHTRKIGIGSGIKEGNEDAVLLIFRSVFRISANVFQPLCVDPASQCVPEMILEE